MHEKHCIFRKLKQAAIHCTPASSPAPPSLATFLPPVIITVDHDSQHRAEQLAAKVAEAQQNSQPLKKRKDGKVDGRCT